MVQQRFLAFTASLILFGFTAQMAEMAFAQTATQLRRDRLQGSLDIQNARIGEQRVQRQTEVMRLEDLMRSFDDRLERMERQWMSISQLPAVTMAEAEAALQLADAQLAESTKLHEEGHLSDVTLARHRLDRIRAQGQLDAAKTAHADRLIALELNVLYAERNLAEYRQEQTQMERLVAKGYSTSEGLRWRMHDVQMAEKQLEQARLRLAAQRKAAGTDNFEDLLPVDPTKSSDPAKSVAPTTPVDSAASAQPAAAVSEILSDRNRDSLPE